TVAQETAELVPVGLGRTATAPSYAAAPTDTSTGAWGKVSVGQIVDHDYTNCKFAPIRAQALY
ncbi:MAG: hypothetical protein WAU02_02295, partial [Candidatus Saccharimonadales bacterium]